MSVEFDENLPSSPSRPVAARRPTFITGLIFKTGIVKTEQGAKIALVVILILSLSVMAFFIKQSTVTVKPPPAEQIIVE